MSLCVCIVHNGQFCFVFYCSQLYYSVMNSMYNVLFVMQVPPTGFQCNGRVEGGYYADPAAECQVKTQLKETVSQDGLFRTM